MENRWISVKDSLPEDEVDCLLCEDNNDLHIGMLFKLRIYKKMWCLTSGGWLRISEITHWMPIPELPKD